LTRQCGLNGHNQNLIKKVGTASNESKIISKVFSRKKFENLRNKLQIGSRQLLIFAILLTSETAKPVNHKAKRNNPYALKPQKQNR